MIGRQIVKNAQSFIKKLSIFNARPIVSTTENMYGTNPIPFTNKMDLFFSKKNPQIPVYRVLDHEGNITGDINTPDSVVLSLYKSMLRVRVMDDFLLKSQRQGTISFYMSCFGEECTIGTAAGVEDDDDIFAQYREHMTLYHRGFSYQNFVDQCIGLYTDEGKGRQMPIHYTSTKCHFVTISSPLATQIPQAAGHAFHQKLTNSKNITLCYFGDGSSSEGDFHSGLNIASTLGSPVFYICRNNGYAISTHISQQFKADGVADRAAGYGIHSLRVDGNDLIAVYQATKAIRNYVHTEKRPFFLELMSNRLTDHSTSDDSTAYRNKEKVEEGKKYDGVLRTKSYLMKKKLWTEEEEEKIKTDSFNELKDCVDKALNAPQYPFDTLYDDVFSTYTDHQKMKRAQLVEHVNKHPEFYESKH